MSTIARDVQRPALVLGGLAYLVLLATSLVWFHLPPDILFLLTLGGIGFVILALNPLIGVHVYVLMWFLEYAIPEKEGLSGMKVVGVAIAGGWLLSVAVNRRLNFKWNALLVIGMLFLAWCSVSTFYSIDPGAAVSRMFTFTQLLVACAMFLSVVDTVPKLRGVFWAIVIWTTLSTVIALVGYYLKLTKVAVGLLGNRNILATYIGIAIVCAYLLNQATESRGMKVLLGISLPILFLGLALTLSRTGLIVLVCALVLVWYRVLREKGFILMLGSLATICAVSLVLPDIFWKRADTIIPAVERQEDTFGTRVRLWRVGMKMIEDRPVTGVGPGNFIPAFERYARGALLRRPKVAHNAYVSVAAEEGLVGLGIFLLMLIVALVYARRASNAAKRQGNSSLAILAVIVEVNLLVIMGHAISGSTEHHKYFWAFIGLAMCVKRMADDMDAEPTMAPAVESSD